MTDPTPRPPLWKLMNYAYESAPMAPKDAGYDWTDRYGNAAEIRAMRDWLKEELPEGGAWYVLLTAEAARAERADG